MSNKDEIEKVFRKRFENDQSPVSDRVWENIRQTLPSENDGSGGSSWIQPAIISGIVIVISSAIGLLLLLNGTKNSDQNTPNDQLVNTSNTSSLKSEIALNENNEPEENGTENILEGSEVTKDGKNSTDTGNRIHAQENINEHQGKIEKNYPKTIENTPLVKEKNREATDKTASKYNGKLGYGKYNNSKERKEKLNPEKGKEEKQPEIRNTDKSNKTEYHNPISGTEKELTADNSFNKEEATDKEKTTSKDGAIESDANNLLAQNSGTENKTIDNKTITNRNEEEKKEENKRVDNKNEKNDGIENEHTEEKSVVNRNAQIKSEENSNVENKNIAQIYTEDNKDENKDSVVKRDLVNSPVNEVSSEKRTITDSIFVKAKENTREEKAKDSVLVEKAGKDSIVQENNEHNEKKEEQHAMVPFSVDVFLSPSLNYRSISGEHAVIADKNNYERMKMTLGGGIRLNYSFNEKLYASLGLQYSNFGEKYIYQKETVTSETKYYGHWEQDSVGGVPTQVYIIDDSVITVRRTEKSAKSKNYYRYFSIPLSITYSFGKGKIRYALSAGISTNFLINAYSYRISSDSSQAAIIESTSGDTNPFRRMTTSLMISPAITYNFSERWKLLVEPGFNIFLNSVYRKDYEISHKPYSFTVKAGLRYILK